jgi:hypothetical protein
MDGVETLLKSLQTRLRHGAMRKYSNGKNSTIRYYFGVKQLSGGFYTQRKAAQNGISNFAWIKQATAQPWLGR